MEVAWKDVESARMAPITMARAEMAPTVMSGMEMAGSHMTRR